MFLAILVPVLLMSALTTARMATAVSRPTVLPAGAALGLEPAELTGVAATELEQALRAGGAGYTFEIVQRSAIHVRDGDPLIELPDPAKAGNTVNVDEVAAGTYLERGFVTRTGFYAEIRRGPDDPAVVADWDATEMEIAALVREGVTYRNDGQGWYPTNQPPGIGLDPTSAGLLPTFLRELTDLRPAVDAAPIESAAPEASPADGSSAVVEPARALTGATKVADVPGIIAVDLADATELIAPAELGFDDHGRLTQVRFLARNINQQTYDLIVETVITFGYPDRAPELPAAEPVYVAPAAPAGAGN